jgi:hypothetical protein
MSTYFNIFSFVEVQSPTKDRPTSKKLFERSLSQDERKNSSINNVRVSLQWRLLLNSESYLFVSPFATYLHASLRGFILCVTIKHTHNYFCLNLIYRRKVVVDP